MKVKEIRFRLGERVEAGFSDTSWPVDEMPSRLSGELIKCPIEEMSSHQKTSLASTVFDEDKLVFIIFVYL